MAAARAGEVEEGHIPHHSLLPVLEAVVATAPALEAAMFLEVADIVPVYNLFAGRLVDWCPLMCRVDCPDNTEPVLEVVDIGDSVVDMSLGVRDHIVDKCLGAAQPAVAAVVLPIPLEEVVAHKVELRIDRSMLDCLPSV
jgi:hypothetical protein